MNKDQQIKKLIQDIRTLTKKKNTIKSGTHEIVNRIDLEIPKEVRISNLDEIKFPQFPKMETPISSKIFSLTTILSDLKKAVEKMGRGEVKLELPTSAKNPVAVRLSDGEDFIKELHHTARTVMGGGGGRLNFRKANTEEQPALIDDERHVQVDVLSLPDVTINPGDIEIGAVEIKNAGDDTRATVGANGLYVDVQASSGIGSLTETAPATDTASSGLNGRLQRIAQRITSLIALLPTALGQGTMAQSLKVVIASDQSAVPVSATNLDVRDLTQASDSVAIGDGTDTVVISGGGDAVSNSTNALWTSGLAYAYNGTTWDRVRGDTTNGLDVDVTRLPALAAGTNNIGDVDVLSIAAGDNNIGNVDIASAIPAGTNNIGDVDIASGTVDTVTTLTGSSVAHDAADSGNPHKIGGQARTTNPTAVADSDRVNAIFDDVGRQVVTESIRDLKVSQITTITSSTTETTVLTAGAAGVFHDVYGIICTNSSATATEVHFKDATAGTTRFTISVPAGDMRGFMLPVSAAHNQATTAANWTATCADSVASIIITVMAVKNV